MAKDRPRIQLPKNAVGRINLGQSFAEYDRLLARPEVFVVTPAIQAALDSSRSKCFFVGRRGTGKTAITYYLSAKFPTTINLHPQLFTSLTEIISTLDITDSRQKPVQSLIAAFRRSLVDEIVGAAIESHHVDWDDLDEPLPSERNMVLDHDFDTRTISFIEGALADLDNKNEKHWLRFMRKSRDVAQAYVKSDIRSEYMVLIDRLDETWDGSLNAVILLMALMHACVELAATIPAIRLLLFLRENIFERIRQLDKEFTRLETCVVSLDWTKEQLQELIERRLQLGLNPKPKVGETWDLFFEQSMGSSSVDMVLDFCQHRPRDVITYCSYAVESAQTQRHERVLIEDLQRARKRFSESRLKDLGDEYSENYARIELILNRFHGLTRELTVLAVEGFIKKLLVDDEVKMLCASWFFKYTTPYQFIELLYGIGFWGVKNGDDTYFRSVGIRGSSVPPIGVHSHVVIHPSYVDALDLQDKVLTNIDEAIVLQSEGLLIDLPESFSARDYQTCLSRLYNKLDLLPRGDEHDQEYEEIVGDVIRLCFFRVLSNVQRHQRDVDGRVIRDWIAANVASQGFWEMVRHRHQATQVIWECKNYNELSASDFHQTAYYMNPRIGNFAVVCFRGEDRDKPSYMQHIRRISQNHSGMVILLTDKDLKVFIRQAINGKVKETHIREIYDYVVRRIS